MRKSTVIIYGRTVEELAEDARSRLQKLLDATLNETDKEIVKGTIECTGCGASEEVRIEDIDELPEWAYEHAVDNSVGPGAINHFVGFDIDLMPLPEIDDIDRRIEVGDVNEDPDSQ